MATTEKKAEKKEGTNLLGSPTFKELENGRFRCVETGHEVLHKDKDSYSLSKRCRLGLIDFALSHNKPPLNMFKPDPLSRSKLVCKLTGDTINKSEEHIWKHINGKRFLNKLEEKETQKQTPNGMVEEEGEEMGQKVSKRGKDVVKKEKKKKKKKMQEEKPVEEIISEVRQSAANEESDSEEADFWMPPAGERWDFDDGGDRWGSASESDRESDEANGTDAAVENGGEESDELSTRTKRMSIIIGPSSFASRKKKIKKNTES
ncbi:hypothetical protein L484_002520 [Morus notabilis]|uniref:Surfeit locus protein 2 n=1 Tax=Morus notabilis TaxID=981085 RepID=W9QSF1_9ROSA|nr:uncharacterized protein LOC21386088 [Morus notabilis]EXB37454.1 hypothetical protein L484_002520 [Morus notabilis]